jgi:hypothetical protein
MQKGSKHGSNWGLLLLPVLKEDFQNIFSSVTCSPSHLQASAPLITVQSTLHIAPDLSKNVSLPVSISNNGNSYKI